MSRFAGQLPEGVREGEILAGKYRIGAIIGEGAMGIVVVARHLVHGENVAIKFLTADGREHADSVSRFVHEAKSTMRLQSEHVVRVHDIEKLESGVPYIVMEHLAGSDLATLLRTFGPLRSADAVDYLLEACEAIAEAHRLKIVHRDLKPANLFILQRADGPPSIKVLDFGISKSARCASQTMDVDASPSTPTPALTQTKAILGSPFYMSPEQMESPRDVDERTDIWALGVILFELVTGAPPFTGTSLLQVYSKMMSRNGGGWRRALGHAPKGLDEIIARCLARDRTHRYASVVELARALAPFGSERAYASLQRIARQTARAASQDSTPPVTATMKSANPSPQIAELGSPGHVGRSWDLRHRVRALGAVPIAVLSGCIAIATVIGALAGHRPVTASAIAPPIKTPSPTATGYVRVHDTPVGAPVISSDVAAGPPIQAAAVAQATPVPPPLPEVRAITPPSAPSRLTAARSTTRLSVDSKHSEGSVPAPVPDGSTLQQPVADASAASPISSTRSDADRLKLLLQGRE